MSKALIIVDYQNDFVAEDGKLTAGEPAQNIEGHIVKLVEEYKDKNYEGVVFAYDCHYMEDFTEKKHPEGKVFDAHCVKGEKGYEYYGKVNDFTKIEDTDLLILDKRGYALSHKDIEKLVDKYDEFTFGGVVTDICVFQNVIAFYNHGCNIEKPITLNVDTKACASFNQEREQITLDYMKDVLGVNII